ncbi:AbrB family transcriptional regulator [Desulfovibrio sp. OttesenSCG-928-C06]|nr:AbrB family transcriptional regulator [Desulfovibrio sp. OttesenSCG-928-C06]
MQTERTIRKMRRLRWLALTGITLVLLVTFIYLRLPAAPMLAGIVAGLLMALRGASMNMPSGVLLLAKGILGCVISSSFTSEVAANLMQVWPLALFSIFSGLLASTVLGWLVTKKHWLPGDTAFWGITPGGGTTMPLMAAAYGGNFGMVAFMQYVRILMVAGITSLAAKLLDASGAADSGLGAMFGPVDWPLFGISLLFAIASAWLGQISRIPAGSMLVPAFLGAILNSTGILQTGFPGWFLALSYAALGCMIGLGFSRELLRTAVQSLPVILGSIFALVAFCGLVGLLLTLFAGIDPLTAFLATCPGGVDSVAILASTTSADTGFVMSIQTSRLFVVLLLGPQLARWFAVRAKAR